MELNELSKNAKGGTELMLDRVHQSFDAPFLEQFQIIPSRVRNIDPDKKTILYLHDLATDPEVQHLKNGGWKKFDKLVFVSHWQQQMYNLILGIPYSAGVVLRNAIEPLPDIDRAPNEKLKLIYTSTPHRGLELLYPVFLSLKKAFPIELEVYSSFALYGWPGRDKPYEGLFDALKADPDVNYHGSQPNSVVREALLEADIFAYPSIWQETSCLCLIEAMSADLVCVHSSLAALPETSMCLTSMYGFTESKMRHANMFANVLAFQIKNILDGKRKSIKNVADSAYNWENRKVQWTGLLRSMVDK